MGSPGIHAIWTTGTAAGSPHGFVVANGVLRKSVDRGQLWQAWTDLPATVQTVKIAPTQGRVVYAGTAGDGVYASLATESGRAHV